MFMRIMFLQFIGLVLMSFIVSVNSLRAQTEDPIVLPRWEVFYGDSLILKSNVEVRNALRPTATILLSEKASDLKIRVKTFESHKEAFTTTLKIIKDNHVIYDISSYAADNSSMFNGVEYLINGREIYQKLRNLRGERLKITYEDEIYQGTPMILGYVAIK